ncbi:Glycoside hydrolase, family 18, catalytic domain and Chitinase II domain and Glycoside hydrolase, catalytic domain and Glycoside hydrolase, superfamily domain-containing protein [Strongyloides ratti]|uniref:Chitinase domain-containing protein 1 n=1 Tax=Strongyloides ratti TaxID=34506 RepID=A0A090L8Y9_STRRB|nr:Glycoside hydrolase, family 18, catalytic domain and Chitinase II domain and Glycoside hydrolase, catalytic domain and Glycoside hydrolase, superfamily domain-containing protein [Strongyloides ratti]CEF63990.1 Glycoside hydrolase, family 18, catalytic domain and Chitinase II domain and Glycoside hydrolase, catalytic domain and Glycoside hydrolase, superfamily domain-containing protein [Strongyloides ratti]
MRYISFLILFFNFLVVVNSSIRNDIIQNGNKLSNDERVVNFPVTLGYVTPWNNKGYDIAKLAGKKFTHIVPVWFQIVPSADSICSIEGTHDIDRPWINEIKNNSPDTKILPRFLIDKWDKDTWINMLRDDNVQRECGKILRNFVLRNDFDGVVLEVYIQSLMIIQDYVITETIGLIEMWSSMLRDKELEVIVPLPTPYHFDQKKSTHNDIKLEFSNIYNSEQFKLIADAVDYVNIMTYDFHGEGMMGPMFWIEKVINYVTDNLESDIKEKILLGVNFYGSVYNQNGVTPILWRDFDKYINDESNYSDIKWNEVSQENFVSAKNKKEIVYFPTKKSLLLRFKYVEKNSIGGIAIWELGQGYNYFTELL